MITVSSAWVVVRLGVAEGVVAACRGVVSSAAWLFLGMAAFAFVASPVLALNENAVPHNGAGITKRRCVGEPNEGMLCNDDQVCNPGTCFPYNIIDLTVNLNGFHEDEPVIPTALELQVLKDHITEVSDELYDVTDGQLLLGTVIIVVDNGAPDAVVQARSGTCLGFVCGNTQCDVNADCPQGQACGNGVCCEPELVGNVIAPEGCDDEHPQFILPWMADKATLDGWSFSQGRITVTVNCFDRDLCFVHEFMHYVAGVRDEYQGHGVDCGQGVSNGWWDHRCFGGKDDNEECDPDTECAPGSCDYDTLKCSNDPQKDCNPHLQCPAQGNNQGFCRRIVCVDAGIPEENPLDTLGCTMRGSRNNPDSELCHDGNHDTPDLDTEQGLCEGQSCWDHFGSEWPTLIKKPAGAPQAGPVQAPVPPQFIVIDNVRGRFVTLIDRSGSMKEEDPRRIDLAVDVTRDFVTLVDDGVDYGLASFSFKGENSDPEDVDATKDFPGEAGLRVLDSNADRNAAKDAIGELGDRAGGATRIGEGLRIAKQMLEENGGEITLDTAVVLVTDGLNNRPEGSAQEDLDDALQELQDCDLPVFVTCIGEAADTDQCAHIAEFTGGLFVAAEETDDLIDAFIQFSAEVQKHGFAEMLVGLPIQGQQVAGPFPILVEKGAAKIIFQINWTNAATDLDLILTGPDGSSISCNAQPLSHGKSCEVAQPPPGLWKAVVAADHVAEPDETFSLRGIIDHPSIRLRAGLERAVVAFPEQFRLAASATVGGLVTSGCKVAVRVEKPDGGTEVLTLVDDGLEGDRVRDDGLYEAVFQNVAGDGDYTFNLMMRCKEGEVFHPVEGENLDGDPPPPPQPFNRATRFSGNLTGAPRDLPPIADICATRIDIECRGPRTGVPLDGTCSIDPDGRGLRYLWSSPTGVFDDPTLATPTVALPPGHHQIFLAVTDASGQSSGTDRVDIQVTDSDPPAMEVVLEPNLLWPPNHRMIDVGARLRLADRCDPSPTFFLDAIVSNEPDDAPGGSDGRTVDDIQDAELGRPDVIFRLRAERDARGPGRFYTATYIASDASGNDSTARAQAFVARERRGRSEPLEIHLVETSDGTRLSWPAVEEAARYHVLRVSVGGILERPNEIDLGPVACVEPASLDPTTAGHEDRSVPEPGTAFIYLVEYEEAGGARSSYGTESAMKPRRPSAGACGS